VSFPCSGFRNVNADVELILYSDALSSFVRSDEGKQAQGKVWKELLNKLERISTGISGNLSVHQLP